MHPNEDLVPILKKLRLSGVLASIDLRVRQAADDNLAHSEFLYRVLHDEVERRESKQLDLRIRRANFEHQKTLDDFDFGFNPDIPKAKIVDLATCSFVSRRENICFVGKTGLGKSHIAQAIGHRACLLGHSVVFTSAQQMFVQLRASRADDSYDRKLQRLVAPDLLILDDLGLRPLTQDEPMDLYEVIRQRYEKNSIIFTSNRDVDEWYPLFNDPLLASAAMDRMLHHCHVVELDGDTYRNPPKGKRSKKPSA